MLHVSLRQLPDGTQSCLARPLVLSRNGDDSPLNCITMPKLLLVVPWPLRDRFCEVGLDVQLEKRVAHLGHCSMYMSRSARVAMERVSMK